MYYFRIDTCESSDLPDVLWPVAAEGDAAPDDALLVVVVVHLVLGDLQWAEGATFRVNVS